MGINTKNTFQQICKIFLLAIGFRLAMYVLAYLFVGMSSNAAQNYDFSSFLTVWHRWDAGFYMNIAQRGYSIVEKGEHLTLAFFPLYGYLIRVFRLVAWNINIAGLLASTFSYAVGCVYFFLLVKRDYGQRVARNAVVLISVFPFGFFFGAIMSEGLFFALSAAVLYYIRGHHWWRAAFLGILVTMTRMQGVLLFVPALMEIGVTYHPINMFVSRDFTYAKRMLSRLAIMCIMFLGTAYYLFMNWVIDGNPFQFMKYQKAHWFQEFSLPHKTIAMLWSYMSNPDIDVRTRFCLWGTEVVLFIFCIVVLILGIRKLKAAYFAYGIAYVFITFSASWLLSAGRYLSCCIPLFIILALCAAKKRWIMYGLMTGFAAMFVVFYSGFLGNLQVF